ncbi:uncharacterized protein [Bemisia tabaci]|uniref:uncharacterized protein n=1 Tax=Bemisia tabaci TaxID=7038 RepID=UPI003B2896E1
MANTVLLESRSFRPFKSSEEYLWAMKEDLAEWLNGLYPELYMNVNNFMDRLDTGVALCRHANNVRKYAEEYVQRRQAAGKSNHIIAVQVLNLAMTKFLPGAKPGTFFARDNVSNFISWCRNGLGVIECLLFETDDLILRKNEKHVILCLLEVARRGAKLGMPAPMLVQLEREIDREIANDKRKHGNNCQFEFTVDEDVDDYSDDDQPIEYGPQPQIVTNDLKSLDEMVREQVEKCRCPTQFPMIRVSEGKYRIGDTKVLIFVRVLRSHVMVRVGGGWDTLSHYLDKHDPCRCKSAHRATTSAKVVGIKSGGPALELNNAQVHYERSPPRTRRSSTSSVGSGGTPSTNLTPGVPNHTQARARNRSRSPTPKPTSAPRHSLSLGTRASMDAGRRSRSPTPRNTRPSGPTLATADRASRPRSKSPLPQTENFTILSEKAATKLGAPRSRSPSAQGKRSRSPSVHRDRSDSYQVKDRSRTPSLHDPDFLGQYIQRPEHKYEYGIDETPFPKISDNFVNEDFRKVTPLRERNSIDEGRNRRNSQDPKGVDTSPAHRVSDNFIGTSQYHFLNPNPVKENRRSASPIRETSGVDYSPAAVRVSDNFVNHPQKTAVKKAAPSKSPRKSISKSSDDDPKSDAQLSDHSDEGYRSLGLVPANAATPKNGSPKRPARTTRSRSVGGVHSSPTHQSPAHQTQSPFRRNASTNRSARSAGSFSNPSSPSKSSKTPCDAHPGLGRKQKSSLTEDTFCQQVADIMQQYAAMMPSPRKDSKPDCGIITRIPAPVAGNKS